MILMLVGNACCAKIQPGIDTLLSFLTLFDNFILLTLILCAFNYLNVCVYVCVCVWNVLHATCRKRLKCLRGTVDVDTLMALGSQGLQGLHTHTHTQTRTLAHTFALKFSSAYLQALAHVLRFCVGTWRVFLAWRSFPFSVSKWRQGKKTPFKALFDGNNPKLFISKLN